MITKDKGCTTRVLYRGFKTNDFILKLIPNSGNIYVLSQLSCFWRSQFRAFCRVSSMLYDSVTSKGLNSVSNSSV